VYHIEDILSRRYTRKEAESVLVYSEIPEDANEEAVRLVRKQVPRQVSIPPAKAGKGQKIWFEWVILNEMPKTKLQVIPWETYVTSLLHPESQEFKDMAEADLIIGGYPFHSDFG